MFMAFLGGLYCLLILAVVLLSEESDPPASVVWLIVIGFVVSLTMLIGGIGGIQGVHKRKSYAIPMGLLSSVPFLVFVFVALAYGASQGHLSNLRPESLFTSAGTLICALAVCYYSFNIEVQKYLRS